VDLVAEVEVGVERGVAVNGPLLSREFAVVRISKWGDQGIYSLSTWSKVSPPFLGSSSQLEIIARDMVILLRSGSTSRRSQRLLQELGSFSLGGVRGGAHLKYKKI